MSHSPADVLLVQVYNLLRGLGKFRGRRVSGELRWTQLSFSPAPPPGFLSTRRALGCTYERSQECRGCLAAAEGMAGAVLRCEADRGSGQAPFEGNLCHHIAPLRPAFAALPDAGWFDHGRTVGAPDGDQWQCHRA